MKTSLPVVALLFALSAHAEPPPSALDSFFGSSRAALLLCQLQAQLAVLKQREGDWPAVAQCVDDEAARVRDLFPPALAEVTGNAPAASLLKDYYAAWRGALDATRPLPAEMLIVYKNRQSEADQRSMEKWRRFEVEIGR